VNTEELILLGSWLLGDNLRDMAMFEPGDFSRSDIFNCLKAGKNNIQVSRELGIPIPELVEIQSAYAPSFYANTLYEWRRDKLQRKILECSTPNEAGKLLEEFAELETLRQGVQAESNLAQRFEADVRARANNEIVPFGLNALDKMTKGLHRTELTTIGARPSVGKSAFALQIALNVVDEGQKVLYFPLEMSTEQTLDRIALMRGYADSTALRTGKGLDEKSFKQAIGQISALELSGRFKIYESKNDLRYITAAVKQEKPFLIVVDQLTQLTCNQRFNSKREQFSHITSTLKRLAMTEKIAVILLAQINRTAQDTEPTISQLKESGSIEEDSDNVILLHRVPEEAQAQPDKWRGGKKPYIINLAKQRSGETGRFGAVFFESNLKLFDMP